MTSSGHAHFDRQRCGVSSIGVRRRRKFGEVSCTECIGKGMTLSDSDGKMETRHPVEGSFGNEFLSIYNHCGVTGGLKSQYVEKKFNFCVFFKTTPYREISKILFRKDSSPHRSTCYGQISWNLADRKSVKPCVAYLTKKNKISPGSPALATARIAPKISRNVLRVLEISSKSVHFRRSYTRTREHYENGRKVFPIFGWSLASSRIINNSNASFKYIINHH